MRPPTDCLSPIGEKQLLAGLQKEIHADFYTSITRAPTVYRGNPFQVEAGLAYAQPGENAELTLENPIRVMRFAKRVYGDITKKHRKPELNFPVRSRSNVRYDTNAP